jgi:hypothetical protein
MNTLCVNKIKILKFFECIILSFFIICCYSAGSSFEFVSFFSKTFIYLFSLYIFFFSLKQYSKLHVILKPKLIIPFFALSLWCCVRAINFNGILLACQSLLLVFASYSLMLFCNFNKRLVVFSVIVAGVVFFIISLIHAFVYIIFENNNFWGLYCLLFLLVGLSRIRSWIGLFLFISSLFFLFFSGTRSAIFGFLFSIFLLAFIRLNIAGKLFLSVTIGFAFWLLDSFGIINYLFSSEFASLVMSLTGKRIESGRFDLWKSIFHAMDDAFTYLIGFGGGVDYFDIVGLKLSPHSGYVYLLSSYGVFGLFLFLYSLVFVAKDAYSKSRWISFILIISLSFREFFEVSLLHNNFSLALLFWGLFSTGVLDLSLNKKSANDKSFNAVLSTL